MKYFVLLLSLLTASCNADWIQDQQADDVYYPGMTGMANVGDYIRVKSLDANGEVDTMEALPQDSLLNAFSTVQVGNGVTANLAKIIEISNVDFDGWYGTFIINDDSRPGSIMLQVFATQNNGGATVLSGSIFGYNEYIYVDHVSGVTSIYIAADLKSTHAVGSILNKNGNGTITYYNNASFNISKTGKTLAPINKEANFSYDGYSATPGITIWKKLSLDLPKGHAEPTQIYSEHSVKISANGITLDDYSESWNAASLQNGWVNYGSPYAAAAYRKMPDGRIEIKGLVKNGSPVDAIIFNLPSGYRPSENRFFSVASNGGHTTLNISSGGDIYIVTGGSTVWTSIEVSFYP